MKQGDISKGLRPDWLNPFGETPVVDDLAGASEHAQPSAATDGDRRDKGGKRWSEDADATPGVVLSAGHRSAKPGENAAEHPGHPGKAGPPRGPKHRDDDKPHGPEPGPRGDCAPDASPEEVAAPDPLHQGRSISFVVWGKVPTRVTVTEQDDGTLRFDLAPEKPGKAIGDLRGFFLDIEGARARALDLKISGDDVTGSRIGDGRIVTLGGDANVRGAVAKTFGRFDVGVEFGTPGKGRDDIQETSFLLSSGKRALSLDLLDLADVGLRYGAVRLDRGGRRRDDDDDNDHGNVWQRGGASKQGDQGAGVARNDLIAADAQEEASLNLLDNDTTEARISRRKTVDLGVHVTAVAGLEPGADGGFAGEVFDAEGVSLGYLTVTRGGLAVLMADGTDLPEGAVGTATLWYTTKARDGSTATARLDLSVTGIDANDPPLLSAGTVSAVEDGAAVSLDLALLGDDPDADENGATLTYDITGAPAEGSAAIAGTLLRFDPGAGFQELAKGETRDVTIAIRATDKAGETATNTVTATVAGVNDAPTMADAAAGAAEDGGAVSVDLSALGADIDSDDDGATLTYAVTAGPAEGSASISGTTLSFDPGAAFQDLDAGETRSVDIGLSAMDAWGAQAFATVTVTVAGAEDPPVIRNDSYSVGENGTITFRVLDNDSDPDGDALTVTAFTGAARGDLTDLGDGRFRFDPGIDFDALEAGDTARVTFGYTATDGATSRSAQVAIDVLGAGENFLFDFERPMVGDDPGDSAGQTDANTFRYFQPNPDYEFKFEGIFKKGVFGTGIDAGVRSGDQAMFSYEAGYIRTVDGIGGAVAGDEFHFQEVHMAGFNGNSTVRLTGYRDGAVTGRQTVSLLQGQRKKVVLKDSFADIDEVRFEEIDESDAGTFGAGFTIDDVLIYA